MIPKLLTYVGYIRRGALHAPMRPNLRFGRTPGLQEEPPILHQRDVKKPAERPVFRGEKGADQNAKNGPVPPEFVVPAIAV